MRGMTDCEHEVDPYPTELVVQRIADSPLPRPYPPFPQIVPCKKCGAPINRGRYDRMISVPDLWGEHGELWPYGRDNS
jgi:hypothetical protein